MLPFSIANKGAIHQLVTCPYPRCFRLCIIKDLEKMESQSVWFSISAEVSIKKLSLCRLDIKSSYMAGLFIPSISGDLKLLVCHDW